MRTIIIFLFLIFTSLSNLTWCTGNEYPYRLFFVSNKLESDSDVVKIGDIVKTASEHGLNGMVFSSPGLGKLDMESPDYIRRLKEVAKDCKEHGVEVIPMIFPVGNGGEILERDKNLAEGLLVLEAPFYVWNGDAVLMSDQSLCIPNGDLEDTIGDRVNMFQLQDIPVRAIFADKKVFKEGATSLRFEKQAQDAGTKGYVAQEVRIKPYRCYKISFWVKTEDIKPARCFLPQVEGKDNRILMEWRPDLSSTGDWQKITFGFNSFDNSTVKICLGLSNWTSGKLWVDDVSIEEVCPINVISRPGVQVSIRNKNTGEIYEEGYDYAPVTEAQLSFRIDHEEPLIKILPGGQIKDGDRLLVSFYQGIAFQDSQVALCMSEPKLYEIWRSQASAIHEAIAPDKYFLNMTQIRAGGSCAVCKQRGIPIAQILGECITRQTNILREINPKAEIFIWSDMLDCNQNARENYCLVDGDLTGSWNYIPRDLIIVCWSQKLKNESLQHFSTLGFRTLASVYADKGVEGAADWLQSLDKTPGASGIMCTTFGNDGAKLASFGDAASGQKVGIMVSHAITSEVTEVAAEKQTEVVSVSGGDVASEEAKFVRSTQADAAGGREDVVKSEQATESIVKKDKKPVSSIQEVITKDQKEGIVTSGQTAEGGVNEKDVSTAPEEIRRDQIIAVVQSRHGGTAGSKEGVAVSGQTTEGAGKEQTAEAVLQTQKVSEMGGQVVASIQTPAALQPSTGVSKPLGTGVVFGLLDGKDDEALKGVKIIINGANFSDNTETDEDGFFKFSDLVAGNYTLTGEKEGCKIQEIVLNLGEGEVLDAGALAVKTIENNIYGYVKDSIRDNPIGNAVLRLRGIKTKFKAVSLSDEDGFFRFGDLGPDTYLVIAKKKGYKRANCAVKLAKGEDKEVELELKTKMRRKNESSDVRIESSKKKDMEEK